MPLPFAAHCERIYHDAHAFAGSGKSLSELVRWVEHSTGVEITPGGADSEHRI
jgi:hypothetical protein